MPVKTCETCRRPVVVARHRYGSGGTVPVCANDPPVVDVDELVPAVREPTVHVAVPRATVAGVMAWVEEDDDLRRHRAVAALAHERVKGDRARKGLVDQLTSIVGESLASIVADGLPGDR